MEEYLLHGLLTSAAASIPNRPALVSPGREISYGELDAASLKISGFLVRSGMRVGDRVGLFLPKCPEAYISIFGILRSGAAYVPIDVQLPPSRAWSIIENGDLGAIVTTSQQFRRLMSAGSACRAGKIRVLFADRASDRTGLPADAGFFEDVLLRGAPGPAAVPMADVNPAYILYTSGSTGTPKGVVISHANALAFVNMANRYFSVTAEDRFASHAPLHFDLSVFDIYAAMKSGAAIVLFPDHLSAFPWKLAEHIQAQKVSIWNSAASVLVRLADRGRIDRFRFDNLRLVHFSGDVLPLKYLRTLRNLMPKAEFYNIYGQTEANSSLCHHVRDLPAADDLRIPIGKPFPNFEVFAVDENAAVVSAPGEEGELYVKSSTVALGYWRDRALTEEKFVFDPRQPDSRTRVYRTGDIARIGEDGSFYFVGRKDYMVKSRGYRIELQEIERVIGGHPLVRQAVAVALPDESIGNRIMAYVLVAEGASLTSQDLRSFCADSLPNYMIPELYEFRDSLPMTSNGKIDRNSLLKDGISRASR